MGGKILRRAEKNLIKKIKDAKKIVFFLDYDGTLTPIRKKPEQAKLKKSTKSLLAKLAKKTWAKVYIISGRILKDVKNLVGVPSLYYIGNHGIEIKGPSINRIHGNANALKPLIEKCYKKLKETINLKGVILENKIYTLSLHYRLVNPKKVPALLEIFNDAIKDLKKTKKIRITKGKKVLEVRPKIKCDKGIVVRWVLKKEAAKNILPICIGDDITDEDTFRALGKRGISILVSEEKRPTYAQYKLSSPKSVVSFLKRVIKIKEIQNNG